MECAKHLKPCVLELGGKAPVVVRDFADSTGMLALTFPSKVLADANIAEAAKAIISGAMLHSGQACCATFSDQRNLNPAHRFACRPNG